MEYTPSHLYTHLYTSVYTKKIQVMSGIFHGYTTRLGVIQLNCTDQWEGLVEY